MKIKNILNTSLIALSLVGSLTPVVNAATYGGGVGTNNLSLQIIKEVKLDGDANFKDKVFIDLTNNDEKSKAIVFRVTVKNNADKVEKLKTTMVECLNDF